MIMCFFNAYIKIKILIISGSPRPRKNTKIALDEMVKIFDQEDIESENYWLRHGIKQERIAKTSEDNFWSAGEVGPCGTDTEIFYFRSDDEIPETFDPEDDRWVEIWNNVFMQYERKEDGISFTPNIPSPKLFSSL